MNECEKAFDIWWTKLYPTIPTPAHGPYDVWAAAWNSAIEAHEAGGSVCFCKENNAIAAIDEALKG